MTVYQDEIEVRRPAVSTKVLILACAILAVLGSFWGIVWFIRAYVEPPRVMMAAPMTLASRESTPVRLPQAVLVPNQATPIPAVDLQAADTPVAEAQAAPAVQPAAPAPRPAVVAGPREAAEPSSVANAVADRWAPMNQSPTAAPASAPAPVLTPAPAPSETAPAALATPESDVEEVAEGSVPAIRGPAPLPRRKPTVTASARRNDPPLPRPRPDGAAPQSVWNAVPNSDDRYPGQ